VYSCSRRATSRSQTSARFRVRFSGSPRGGSSTRGPTVRLPDTKRPLLLRRRGAARGRPRHSARVRRQALGPRGRAHSHAPDRYSAKCPLVLRGNFFSGRVSCSFPVALVTQAECYQVCVMRENICIYCSGLALAG
jgi:hypothetical protein